MSESYNVNALPPGSMLQEYRLLHVIGAGSFGIIYLAENTFLPQRFAIKEFLPSELAQRVDGIRVSPKSSAAEEAYQWALEKFLKEARIIWELGQPNRHPNIVRVARFFEENGTAYMVMDFEEGESLAQRLEAGPISEAALRELLSQLLDGLQRVHERSVWHRDIKPANILIRPDGAPVLIDFGAARQEVGDQSASIMDVYTPDYAAPEQVYAKGHIGPWTDIYGLGATLYRAVMGKPPTSAAQRALGAEHVRAVEGAANDYSYTFLEAIDAAIELKHEDRPQNVEEWRQRFEGKFGLLAEIDGDETVIRPRAGGSAVAMPGADNRAAPSRLEGSRLATGAGVPRGAESGPPGERQPARRRGLPAVLGALLLVIVGGGAAVFWLYGGWVPGEQSVSSTDAGATRVTDSGAAQQATADAEPAARAEAGTSGSTAVADEATATPSINEAEVTRLVDALTPTPENAPLAPSPAGDSGDEALASRPSMDTAVKPADPSPPAPQAGAQTGLPQPQAVVVPIEALRPPPVPTSPPEPLVELPPEPLPPSEAAQQTSAQSPAREPATESLLQPTPPGEQTSLALARPAIPPSPERILGQAEQLIAEAECAALRISLSDDLQLRLSGYASSRPDLDRLVSRLARLDSVNGVKESVALYDRPFCEVLQILNAEASLDSGTSAPPQLEPDKASHVYLEGELLKLTAQPTRAFDGYLYVDYIDGEGNVLHLLPAPHRTQNWLAAGEVVLLGRDRQYEIAPPHGQSMIIAISSRAPLFDTTRPEIESVTDYLPVLRSRLRAAERNSDSADVTSTYTVIKTRAKDAALLRPNTAILGLNGRAQPFNGGSNVKPNSAGSAPITAAEKM